jgi:hypothetical protein
MTDAVNETLVGTAGQVKPFDEVGLCGNYL